jgi:hypothetical protein
VNELKMRHLFGLLQAILLLAIFGVSTSFQLLHGHCKSTRISCNAYRVRHQDTLLIRWNQRSDEQDIAIEEDEELPEEVLKEIERGQPSEWMVMKEVSLRIVSLELLD